MCHASDRARQIHQHSERALSSAEIVFWRTAACSATSQLSVSRKTAHQSFVISQLQSRRFACAMPRIAQGKYISIRSGRYRVQEILFGAPLPCSATSQLSVSRKTAHQSFVISQLQSRRLRVPCIGSPHANPSTFGAGAMECRNLIWRTAALQRRRLSFPLAGKPHIKPLYDFTTSIATICVCHASDRATQSHQHSELKKKKKTRRALQRQPLG